MAEQQLEQIEGTVEDIIYENTDNGYMVFEVSGGGVVTVVCGIVGELHAATPYSSILPVDSGVFSARKRAFSTPSAQTLSGTSKCTVSPSTCVLTVALVLAVAEDMFS